MIEYKLTIIVIMDLHSYAKQRGVKKWSLEHKRKLVEARIYYDEIFVNQPSTSLAPWKKLVSLAKLNDYNAFFVRKQWYNMVAKYKEHKQNRLGNLPTKAIDNEMLQRITEEWEFFKPIHSFMTNKTTKLHSYALKEPNQVETLFGGGKEKTKPVGEATITYVLKEQQQQQEEKQNQKCNGVDVAATTSSSERLNVLCSSDTNYDSTAAMGIPNDHDFYSKKLANKKNHLINFFDDDSEDTQESIIYCRTLDTHFNGSTADDSTLQLPAYVGEVVVGETTNNDKSVQHFASFDTNGKKYAAEHLTNKQKTTTATAKDNRKQKLQCKRNSKRVCEKRKTVKKKTLSSTITPTLHQHQEPKEPELFTSMTRDAYYRHKRRYNHRQERRFDALLSIFGQILKTEYPSVDVSALSTIADAVKPSSDEEI